ncbi:hypothetical protein SprV_0501969900 [Sparganum proliferum]
MKFLIVLPIFLHCAESCVFINKIPECPRNGSDIILDDVAEFLAHQAYRGSCENNILLQTNSRLKLKLLKNRTSIHFKCAFLRDVAPANYLQYTCRSPSLKAKLHIEKQSAVGYWLFDLPDLALELTKRCYFTR